MRRRQVEPPRFKSGDIIGFSGHDWVSDVINLASLGVPRYSISHVGIVGVDGPDVLLYESLHESDFRGPCVRHGRQIRRGVQAHRLDDVLAKAPATAIWHYPLRRPLYPHEELRLVGYLDSLIGLPYDVAGAARSAGLFLPWLEACLFRENRNSYFCSELCADALVMIGLFQTSNIGYWCPNRFCRHLTWTGAADPPNRRK